MGKYFGTDGVRGEANVELTPELAFKLGRFGGYVLSQHENERPRVFVGRDTRISGQLLESALVAGLLSVGIEVYLLGVVATPGVSYLVRTEKASAGVMISASHNPALDNGIFRQLPFLCEVFADDVHDLVTINQLTIFIYGNQAVAITIKGKSHLTL